MRNDAPWSKCPLCGRLAQCGTGRACRTCRGRPLTKTQASALRYIARNGTAEGLYYERMQRSEAHGQFLVLAVDRTLNALQRRGLVTDEFALTEAGGYALRELGLAQETTVQP